MKVTITYQVVGNGHVDNPQNHSVTVHESSLYSTKRNDLIFELSDIVQDDFKRRLSWFSLNLSDVADQVLFIRQQRAQASKQSMLNLDNAVVAMTYGALEAEYLSQGREHLDRRRIIDAMKATFPDSIPDNDSTASDQDGASDAWIKACQTRLRDEDAEEHTEE
jgi:hypothetical protein